jgi:hypothetical protein
MNHAQSKILPGHRAPGPQSPTVNNSSPTKVQWTRGPPLHTGILAPRPDSCGVLPAAPVEVRCLSCRVRKRDEDEETCQPAGVVDLPLRLRLQTRNSMVWHRRQAPCMIDICSGPGTHWTDSFGCEHVATDGDAVQCGPSIHSPGRGYRLQPPAPHTCRIA